MTDKPLSPEPVVKLVKYFPNSFRNVIATARTCYSSKGIIKDDEIDLNKYIDLAKSIYQAGHHTTFQHAHFQFAIENVSRQFIWSFLHSHPFYNSEQVSQRYVEVKSGNYFIPPIKREALEIYISTVEYQNEIYKKLTELLTPVAEEEYFKRFPARKFNSEKYKKDVKRKAQEVARYVLPVATFAYLYHTVSAITVLRYYKICKLFDVPLEQKLVVEKMINEILKVEPDYEIVLEKPIEQEELTEFNFIKNFTENKFAKEFAKEFDESLNGNISRLVDYKPNAEKILADSVREIFGLPSNMLSDDEAINLVLNPHLNKILAESLVLTTHSKISRAMFHISYTFRKKLSHTADSQDQRHRMTPASRPVLICQVYDEPDFIIPNLIYQSDIALKLYTETMQKIWENIYKLKKLGVSDEFAFYLLPNAVSIRFTESGDLLNLHHKYAMRLCYNAQEEIWRASVEEVKQISEVHPRIGKFLLPPCSIRDLAGIKPICPEGERFCGVKVWKLKLNEYSRVI
ncbi:FAD-dependent thymidylate synthase [Candidatus Chrysopegis kryptomonas]|uniref:Thymidylate synthase complementing protein n=1 Tax=Candidatus Chryseopegocella kryptomonas TaxID=1633643 RepID=A0A0P1MNB0_9BACT|nr:FAD-dependent thymidylate synthase [Candidatus Chrysopegis kryptomonas]CUS97241.1 Thymidylate synthase complementing protein [Candidatus Chrysopegis kryptomonas]